MGDRKLRQPHVRAANPSDLAVEGSHNDSIVFNGRINGEQCCDVWAASRDQRRWLAGRKRLLKAREVSVGCGRIGRVEGWRARCCVRVAWLDPGGSVSVSSDALTGLRSGV